MRALVRPKSGNELTVLHRDWAEASHKIVDAITHTREDDEAEDERVHPTEILSKSDHHIACLAAFFGAVDDGHIRD